MARLRRPVTLGWVPRGLRLELEVAGRDTGDGAVVPVRARAGGIRAQRGWLTASDAVFAAVSKTDEADSAIALERTGLVGRDVDWILGAGRRRWSAIAKRFSDPEDEAERLARAGVVEIECQLTDALTLSGYVGWRLTTPAAEAAGRRHEERRTLRTDLERQLRDEDLVLRLRHGQPPHGMGKLTYVRILRAAEAWRSIAKNGRLPPERELAAIAADNSKWQWTPARRRLLAELVEAEEDALFAPKRRVIRLKGPLSHGEGNVWADAVDTIDLRFTHPVRGVVCIENRATFDVLYPFWERGWVLLEIGGPLPAECRLLHRLHALAPGAPVLAAFDPDPAGIEIALYVAARADVSFDTELMSPAVFAAANQRALAPWDRESLDDLRGRAGSLESLREALAVTARKAEQEAAHELLFHLLEARTTAGT